MIRKIILRLGQLVLGLVCIGSLVLVAQSSSTGDDPTAGWVLAVISLVLFWGWSRIFRGKGKSPQEVSKESTTKEKTEQDLTAKEEKREHTSNKPSLEEETTEPLIDKPIDVDKQSAAGINVALEDYEGLLVALLAALAYWGDGGISKNEKAHLLRVIKDSLLQPDTVEPEIESRELLLVVLEALESTRNGYEQKVDKEEAIKEIVKFYARNLFKKVHIRSEKEEGIENSASKNKALLSEAIIACEAIIEIDGTTSFEEDLLKIIKTNTIKVGMFKEHSLLGDDY